MVHSVLMSEDAEHDIEDIYRFIARHDSVGRARHVLDELQSACDRLSEMPERGNVPKELEGLGMTDYRETHFKPYRLIYRVFGTKVIVYCVVDGRRDMQSFLERRLLRSPSGRS